MRTVLVELPAGTARALVRALASFTRANGAIAVGLALLTAAAALAGLVVVAHGIAVLLLALLANVVHELGHIVAYRLAAPGRPALLECDGLRTALHREPLPVRCDRAVTAAGPLAPVLLAAVMLPFAAVLPAEAVAAVVIAVAQALGLLLPTADRRAWREAGHPPSRRDADSPTLGA